jgi:pimeloyl-ACP methyl ester carboxylesterase
VDRLIAIQQLLTRPARGDPVAPSATPLRPSANFTQAGPASARGVLVWLHGTYDSTASGPPDEPDWVARMADRGLDIWRFDRKRGQDALTSGGEALAGGLAALRTMGYRHIIVAGHSRGAWIALTALAHPGLADAVVALSPAAYGTRPERQAQAMAAWAALWQAAAPAPTRVVLVQLAGDPYDPDPGRRRAIAEAESARAGLHLLSVYLPPAPRGHVGAYEPDFDTLLGAKIAAFADPAATDR